MSHPFTAQGEGVIGRNDPMEVEVGSSSPPLSLLVGESQTVAFAQGFTLEDWQVLPLAPPSQSIPMEVPLLPCPCGQEVV